MCLTTYDTRSFIVDRDIHVYKELFVNEDGSLESPFRNYPYKQNKLVKAWIRPLIFRKIQKFFNSRKDNFPRDYYDINRGLHSFAARPIYIRRDSYGITTFHAIIPKGSRIILEINSDELERGKIYLKNKHGRVPNIVSNRLIIKKPALSKNSLDLFPRKMHMLNYKNDLAYLYGLYGIEVKKIK